ncbi:hypothetical protein [Halobacillus trueperi]|uniref:hypothetical protein n=1 Tax=Halobacillus trueperi TaxID=156205 RepID=UPI0021630394|nr:hypothetical protein [Halobacillus trueperi]
MKENLTFAWIASWFALVGQLAFFIVVALFTGEWRYVMWSLLVSLSVRGSQYDSNVAGAEKGECEENI